MSNSILNFMFDSPYRNMKLPRESLGGAIYTPRNSDRVKSKRRNRRKKK